MSSEGGFQYMCGRAELFALNKSFSKFDKHATHWQTYMMPLFFMRFPISKITVRKGLK